MLPTIILRTDAWDVWIRGMRECIVATMVRTEVNVLPHIIKLKDGRLATPFGIRDVLDAVEEYAGDEVRRYLEENISDAEELEAELDALEKGQEEELEQQGDYQRALLNDIKAEAETLAELLDADRLDRKKLKKAADNIWRMCYREL